MVRVRLSASTWRPSSSRSSRISSQTMPFSISMSANVGLSSTSAKSALDAAIDSFGAVTENTPKSVWVAA